MGSSLNGTGVTFNDGTSQTSGQQAAKAWINFNGADGTRRASYNVSSVTRTAAGQYTVNLSNAVADASYSVVTNGWISLSTGGFSGAVPVSSSQFTLSTYQGAGFADQTYVFAALFR